MVVNSLVTTGVDGRNDPFLVMLHGFGTDQRWWSSTRSAVI